MATTTKEHDLQRQRVAERRLIDALQVVEAIGRSKIINKAWGVAGLEITIKAGQIDLVQYRDVATTKHGPE